MTLQLHVRYGGELVLIYFVKLNFLSEYVKANNDEHQGDVCSCTWQRRQATPQDCRAPRFKDNFHAFISF